ncbi:MAG: 6-bladed beta-propeller [Syntrophales bacterium]
MKIKLTGLFLGLSLIVFVVIGISIPVIANVQATYLYGLSNFTGKIPYSATRMSVDKKSGEIYVIYENLLKVFNPAGMEIYHFGEDLDVGQILDLTVVPNGDLLLLTVKDSRETLVQCNYRGDPISRIDLKKMPPEFSGFVATRLVCHGDSLYFASGEGMKIVITDLEGNFKKGYDLISLLELKEEDRGNMEIYGFSVDGNGNILFTIAVLFKAFVLSDEGKLSYFGKAGGAPGKFNIVSVIVRDSQGNFLVVDRLKSAVMIFDKKFNFVTQFGFRGLRPENLFAPDDIAIDSNDRIYVTQERKRGISVFKLTHN